eukprot:jgi/Astpho2/4740/Aster-00291
MQPSSTHGHGAGAGAGAGIGAVEHGRHHGGQDSQAGYDTRHTSAGGEHGRHHHSPGGYDSQSSYDGRHSGSGTGVSAGQQYEQGRQTGSGTGQQYDETSGRAQPTLGEKIKSVIPGTDAHRAKQENSGYGSEDRSGNKSQQSEPGYQGYGSREGTGPSTLGGVSRSPDVAHTQGGGYDSISRQGLQGHQAGS